MSQGVLRACMGSEAAHLLVEDAEDEVRPVRMQGFCRPPAAGLTTSWHTSAASGDIMPVQSCRSGPSSSKHTKHGSQTARRRSAEGRRARRVGSGRCVGLTGAWRWCRGKRVQGCGRRLDQQAGMQRTGSGRRGVGGTWPRWAPPAPPPRRPHFRSRWRGWGRRSGRPGRSSGDTVASFCLPAKRRLDVSEGSKGGCGGRSAHRHGGRT